MNAQNLPAPPPPVFRQVFGAQMDISPMMCPFSHTLMQDPVIFFVNGESYERSALIAFLAANPEHYPTHGPAFVSNTTLRVYIRSLFPPTPLSGDEAPVEESGPIE